MNEMFREYRNVAFKGGTTSQRRLFDIVELAVLGGGADKLLSFRTFANARSRR